MHSCPFRITAIHLYKRPLSPNILLSLNSCNAVVTFLEYERLSLVFNLCFPFNEFITQIMPALIILQKKECEREIER